VSCVKTQCSWVLYQDSFRLGHCQDPSLLGLGLKSIVLGPV
jgi:hypothetical protein